jgi:hypothetical protein
LGNGESVNDDSKAVVVKACEIVIPVIVQVLFDPKNSKTNVEFKDISEMLTKVNECFNGRNPDLASVSAPFQPMIGSLAIDFQFSEASVRRKAMDPKIDEALKRGDDNPMWAAHPPETPESHLNVYIVPNLEISADTMLAAFSSRPGQNIKQDGFVLLSQTVQTLSRFGNTPTHELGHYLGLFHPWGRTTTTNLDCIDKDFVSDTPVQYEPIYGPAPNGPVFDKCTTAAPGINPYNFMGYFDNKSMFTKGSVARMINQTQLFRPKLLKEGIPIQKLFLVSPKTFPIASQSFLIAVAGSKLISGLKRDDFKSSDKTVTFVVDDKNEPNLVTVSTSDATWASDFCSVEYEGTVYKFATVGSSKPKPDDGSTPPEDDNANPDNGEGQPNPDDGEGQPNPDDGEGQPNPNEQE